MLNKLTTNKITGIPIFLFIMWTVFQLVFTLGQIPADLIDKSISIIQNWLTTTLPQSLWSSLLIDGVIGGVGALIVFLPIIILLFFFISVLQQSGYLDRIAHLFESFFNKIGLSGKSIVPLIMGFGCNVPAILALKNLETKRQKIITAMMIPFLSCSATLPIYTLIIAAFVEERWRGTVLFGLYATGILISFLTGSLLNNILKPEIITAAKTFPKYKIPGIKNITEAIWKTVKSFLSKAGKIILPFSIIMWILFTFPQSPSGTPALIQDSYASQISMAIEPIFEPIGFDWKITTALFGALGAKEVFISTMGVIYSLDVETADGLIHALQNDPAITPLTAILILIFILLYSPCIPVIATIKQEFNTRWAIFAFAYPMLLAWTTCFIIFQVFKL